MELEGPNVAHDQRATRQFKDGARRLVVDEPGVIKITVSRCYGTAANGVWCPAPPQRVAYGYVLS